MQQVYCNPSLARRKRLGTVEALAGMRAFLCGAVISLFAVVCALFVREPLKRTSHH
jgi:hypothetical protein